MKISTRMYAYPVLSEDTYDYKDASFEVEMDQKMDGINTLNLIFKLHLYSAFLNELIYKQKAAFLIHLECSTTAFRKVIKTSSSVEKVEIPISKLSGKLEILAFVVLIEDSKNLYSEEWDEDYEETSFNLGKGTILAYENLPDLMITKDYEEFTNAKSIFSIYKLNTNDERPIDVNLEGNKIRIGLPIKEFNIYKKYASSIEYQSILNSMMIFPALVYVFEELKQEEGIETYRTRSWYISLYNSYLKRGLNFEDEILRTEKKSIQLAQEVMNSPISKSFANLGSLRQTIVEEE